MLGKKLNRAPIHSPSPDIVNKNMNVRTASPINEVLIKTRMAKSSKSPLGKAFLNNQEYQQSIRSLQDKNIQLSKENSNLQQQNARQLQQIDFLKEMNLRNRKQLIKKSQPYIRPQFELRTQHESRIADLLKEISRLQDILQSETRKNETISKQNQNLKNQLEQITKRSPYEEFYLNKKLNQIQNRLHQSFEKRLSEYQGNVELVLSDEINKIDNAQKNQRILQNMLMKRRMYDSPGQLDKSVRQYSTTGNQTHSRKGKQEDSCGKDISSINIQSTQCQNCKIYCIRIAELEKLRAVKQFTQDEEPSQKKQTINTQSPQLEEYLRKLEEIKLLLSNEEMKSSINNIETNLEEMDIIDEKMQYLTTQKNKIIEQLQEKEMRQQVEMIGLRKENAMLKAQVKGLNEEINSLKDLINIKINSFRKDQPSYILAKSKSNIGEADILRKYLEQAVSRIEKLENQIQNTLKE